MSRIPPSPFTIALVQVIGFLTLFTGAAVFMKGLYSGTIRPAEIAARFPHYRDVVLDAVPTVLGGGAAVIGSLLVLVLAAKHSRAVIRAWITVWWRYRRRWARVLAHQELTVTDAKHGHQVPTLRVVTTDQHADVLTVAMLPGQTPEEWHRASSALAKAFGAKHGQVRMGADSDIDLVLSRRRGGQLMQKALPAPKTPAIALTLPGTENGQPRGEAVAFVRAWTLQIGYARVIAAHTDQRPARRNLFGFRWLTVRTAVMA
ncbi:hypothetical protein [Nocardia acidivorans]|uniref:hypothetical protein n=1 Tax=Nocardia acidivorans TaxID=404580 RepID=UPI000832DF69|nr:hypothetical protein [Nocardia acidivorans]